ncbi:FecCD family ABC transporter permease [Stackebrandtia nassauensis]|uniref:Transport system permease protein n=1 Tax=Stackebrandtia nassauensis (strain DSM 44728 / CIP 108903 / NRRL B-16338 / NBRC 102104 / LLR-40K-21) TaxID=446470 RepID=D3Q5A8_STANL|nr:iron ABC transporter permease [Stackebrandtia nassauensis]ADD44157.1 transport system permease protein [Stackebrandtia nassauensis DSM 44728]
MRPPGTLLLRARGVSLLLPVRPVLVTAALCLALFASCALSVAVGNGHTTGMRAVAALFTAEDVGAWRIVNLLRLPRFVAGALAGAALGAAGCLIQTLARNRLATPDLVGVTDGATVGVLLSVLGTSAGTLGAWWAGPAGAMAAAALVMLLAGGLGTTGYRILVVGVGLSVAIDSITELVLARQNLHAAQGLLTWTLGYLNGRDYASALPVLIGLAVLIPVAVLCSARLRALHFGDDTASTLGVSPGATRALALLIAVLLAGLAVGVAGPIAFVAMAAPVLASYMSGRSRVPVLVAALAGAVLVSLADTLGRGLGEVEIPVGVLTSLLGGPFLLWVLLTRKV